MTVLKDLRSKDAEDWCPVLAVQLSDGSDGFLAHRDGPALRRIALFDAVVNNADRKGGHVLRGVDGDVYGVDHGLCLHVEDKLRTVLWGWAGKPIDDNTLDKVACLVDGLGDSLGDALASHITSAEIAALRLRARALLNNPVMPGPDRHRPIPWPAF